MLDPSLIEAHLRQLAPEQLQAAIAGFLPPNATTAERVRAIETALASPAGPVLRAEMGRWIVEHLVPVEGLVPAEYAEWRPPVRDAMLFVVSHLSNARLAPKLLEQLELPLKTPPEKRLLRLISKVPGLQKLGQVLARNRHLRPSLRNALSKLENGIRDVKPQDICALIEKELGPRLQTYAVKMKPVLLSEASVSAVLRFTWRNPISEQRERGVFKVLKPHIPPFFAEDMDLLQKLAEFFGTKHREYGPGVHAIPDTFTKVRQLLEHEVDFVREQATLLEVRTLYRAVPRVRVPELILPLCTSTITAITEEHGLKVTQAVVGMPASRRAQVAEQLVEALVAAPLFASEAQAMFHADPHAGNLLYNRRTGELVVLDWALTERLTRDQRRHLAVLVVMVGLRDPVGACNEVHALMQHRAAPNSRQSKLIRDCVSDFVDELPLRRLPNAVDAMRLLEELAVKGIRFPAPLIMFSKVLFTLDGILEDIRGAEMSMGSAIARHLAQRWLTEWKAFGSPLRSADWMAVQCSALLYSPRLWVRLEQTVVDRLLPRAPSSAVADEHLRD
jgi:ubiquinone biosynthesis protein